MEIQYYVGHISILHHILQLLIILKSLGSTTIEYILEYYLVIFDNIKLDSNGKVKIYSFYLQISNSPRFEDNFYAKDQQWVFKNMSRIESHTHNFWYFCYAFIFILISWNLHSYSKLKVLIILTTFMIFNIYTKHKTNMIHVRILKYSLKGCVFAVFVVVQLAALSFLLICLVSLL